ncbi:MAG: TPM domain-containing protein, partial [Clostridia bacterium]|nr:TPM domain-containing protein [Clostridia bacterium]
MRKRIILLPVLLTLFALFPVVASAVYTKPMDAFFVNDYADVISDADKQRMLAIGEALEDATGAQVVVATINYADGLSQDEYTYQLFDAWQLGQKDKDNGVLLVLCVGERWIQAEIGIGLKDSLPPSVVGKLQDDYAMPHLGRNDFSRGMRDVYEA